MKKIFFFVIFILLLTSVNSKAQNLLLNPSFEFGINPPAVIDPPYQENSNGFRVLPSATSSLSNWTVTTGTIEWIHATYWQASEGTYSININNGSAIQSASFITNPGSPYLVEFDLSSNPLNYTAILNVTAGLITQSFSFNGNGNSVQNMGWVRRSFSFTANSASTSLIFADVTNGVPTWFGSAVDNISVTPIPEPGTAQLLGAGFLGLGIAAYFRRKKR